MFSTDGLVLLCKVYNVKVAVDKRFTIQHISRDKHINGVQRREQIEEQEKICISTKTYWGTTGGTLSSFSVITKYNFLFINI
jgi:hypothetical protein